MPKGQKHLVQCRCYLPQFRKLPDPPFHQFPVFSIIDDNDIVRVKFAQCPNCGAVHKVIDITRSEIINGRNDLQSVVTISEIKVSLTESLAEILETNDCDVATWEHAKFIIDNSLWGSQIVIKSESIDGMRHGKYVRILGERLFKVDEFNREEYMRSI